MTLEYCINSIVVFRYYDNMPLKKKSKKAAGGGKKKKKKGRLLLSAPIIVL